MVQVYNPRTVEANQDIHTAPVTLPQAPGDGPLARAVYKNVQVLGDLSVAQFARHMVSITSWVAPNEGCTYCHNPANFAEDSKYTKVVARRMIQMTQHINADWQPTWPKQVSRATAVTAVSPYLRKFGSKSRTNTAVPTLLVSVQAKTWLPKVSSWRPCHLTPSRHFCLATWTFGCPAPQLCPTTTATPSSKPSGPTAS
jgi:hypothetical protein